MALRHRKQRAAIVRLSGPEIASRNGEAYWPRVCSAAVALFHMMNSPPAHFDGPDSGLIKP